MTSFSRHRAVLRRHFCSSSIKIRPGASSWLITNFRRSLLTTPQLHTKFFSPEQSPVERSGQRNSRGDYHQLLQASPALVRRHRSSAWYPTLGVCRLRSRCRTRPLSSLSLVDLFSAKSRKPLAHCLLWYAMVVDIHLYHSYKLAQSSFTEYVPYVLGKGEGKRVFV